MYVGLCVYTVPLRGSDYAPADTVLTAAAAAAAATTVPVTQALSGAALDVLALLYTAVKLLFNQGDLQPVQMLAAAIGACLMERQTDRLRSILRDVIWKISCL